MASIPHAASAMATLKGYIPLFFVGFSRPEGRDLRSWPSDAQRGASVQHNINVLLTRSERAEFEDPLDLARDTLAPERAPEVALGRRLPPSDLPEN